MRIVLWCMVCLALVSCRVEGDGQDCIDEDGDGWCADEDCDDSDPDVSDDDLDGDGFSMCWGELVECNDNDPTVNRFAPERCDTIDHNCNGIPGDAPEESCDYECPDGRIVEGFRSCLFDGSAWGECYADCY